MIYLQFFDILLALIFIQALSILSSRSPITSILMLINIYLTSAICYLIIGAEFLALSIIIVYIGAIAILFLFVIMMLNIRVVELFNTYVHYIPIVSLVGIFFVGLVYYLINNDYTIESSYIYIVSHYNWAEIIVDSSNINRLGHILYNHYFYFVIFAGLILLLAMVGSIALTVEYDYHQYKNRLSNTKIGIKVLQKNIKYNHTILMNVHLSNKAYAVDKKNIINKNIC